MRGDTRSRSAGVEFEYVCAVWRVFGIEAGSGRLVRLAWALGLLHAFARRADGRDLLLLGGKRAESLRDQVRVGRDHILPTRCVHDVRRVARIDKIDRLCLELIC